MGIVWVCLVCCGLWGAKGEGQALRGPYFGQATPGDTPVVFAPGVISLNGRYENACSFSSDGKVFLFSTHIPKGTSDIMVSRIYKGKWTAPKKVDFSKGKHPGEMEAFFSPDDKTVPITMN